MGWEYFPHHPSLSPVCLLNNDGHPDSFCSSRCRCYGPGGSDRTGCFSGHQSISSPKWARSLDVEHRPGQQCQATRDLVMQAANTLSHQLPGEAALGDRERQQGVNWSWAAENIGATSDQTVNGALGLHQAMMAEQPPDDGHRQNILTTSGTVVGVAILIDQQHGQLWLTEDFAHV